MSRLLISATILHVILGVGNCKHLAKRSEIINGRGFAAPPKLNIETYHQNSVPRNQVKQQYHSDYTDRYYQPNDHQDSHYQDYYQTESDYGYEPENSYHSYIPQSDYDRLKQKLSTNDQLRSYIKKLKQKLNEYKNINPRQEHRIQMNNHERATSIDLSRYQRVPNQRTNYSYQNTNQGLDTDSWLRNREQQQVRTRGSQSHSSRQNSGNDIITVENIHQFVEQPKGPDTFTINVESNLNFT